MKPSPEEHKLAANVFARNGNERCSFRGVSIFAISTFDTDYLMVKEQKLDVAVRALKEAGHKVDIE